jgi:protein disulfide-isomerase A1
MKLSTILIATLIISSVFAVESWGFKEEDDVIVAETSTFEEIISKHDFVLVEFYAPWCGHCKKLTPEYSQAAAVLKKADPAVPLVKVDATIEKDLATKYGVSGFPTLKWFVKGTESEYNGGRTKAEIVEWIVKKTGPASKSVNSAQQLKDLQDEHKVLVVYFGSADSDAKYQTFMQAASTTDGVIFGHSFDAAMLAEYGNKVVLFKQFDEKRNDLDGDFDAAAMTKFLEENRYEIVMPFEGEEPIQRIFQKENAALVLFSDKTGDHETAFRTFAAANKGRIIFASSTTNEGLGQRLAEYIGVKSEDAPCVRLIHPTGGDLHKYEYTGSMDTEGWTAYLERFESGALERAFKSAEAPTANDDHVKVIVGTTFDEFVTNSGKDVLVEFYAPWCGHCKTLAPKYEAAAKQLAHLSGKLTIAKVDSTENEVPGVQIQGFPTLKYWKAGNPTPIDYDGERETEGIVSWIKKNASFEWSEPSATDADL